MNATIPTPTTNAVLIVLRNGDVERFEPGCDSRDELVAWAREHWALSSVAQRKQWQAIALGDGELIWEAQQAPAPATVHPGYYAVDGKRYHVSMPGEDSKWHGFTFVATGSDYHSRKTVATIKPNGQFSRSTRDTGRAVWCAIKADPFDRMAEYGQITGTCGKCGRKLEDPESRAIGIGPICRGKL